ncbi:hypothetical protein LZC95_19910 [Pendulispora brunnea]|uniref:Uncharacterized protein n=1 Tax=Pendulispora brunnea TaxID=2905690 RepID=A0ABZ2KK86_9BACT
MRREDAEGRPVTVTVRVHERVLQEFRTLGAELRMALTRWKEVCLELFATVRPSPERARLLTLERRRLEYRIAMLECASTDRSIQVGLHYDRDTEHEIWRQVREAEGLSLDERGLATTIRINGLPGTAVSRKELYDEYAKEPLPL